MLRWDKLMELARGEPNEDSREVSRLKKRYTQGSARPDEILELAHHNLKARNSKACEDLLGALLTIDDLDEFILREACMMLESIGRYDLAMDGYKMLHALVPDIALPVYMTGRLKEIQGRFDEAIETHQRAISIEPDNPECYYRLGVAYTKIHMFDEAEQEEQSHDFPPF